MSSHSPHPPDPGRYEAFPIPESAQDGTIEAVLSTARDVTARKRVEEALREKENQYTSLFENSMDAVLLTAPDGQILAANPAPVVFSGAARG